MWISCREDVIWDGSYAMMLAHRGQSARARKMWM